MPSFSLQYCPQGCIIPLFGPIGEYFGDGPSEPQRKGRVGSMKSGAARLCIAAVLLIGAAAWIGWLIIDRLRDSPRVGAIGEGVRPAPVEAAAVERGAIELRRTFSGELEAPAQFVVAPKVSGRVERMLVKIADPVERGQVVVELDNAEYVQEVTQARADLLVAKAILAEAQSALEIAEREFKRTESLLKRGIASDSEFDVAKQDRLARQAQLKVAEARVKRAESSLETANIRLGYTKVTADWSGGDENRVVAERFVAEGQTVAENADLLSIVELDTMVGVVFVTERDYARLTPGQPVSLTTDAWSGERFSGRIDRIAPVFRRTTRQARVEMMIDNPNHRLKPGMFIKAEVVLARAADVVIVPEQALTIRDDKTGVFVIDEKAPAAVWRQATVGIREGDRVQVEGDGIAGRVVVLGQQLVKDGSPVVVSGDEKKTTEGPGQESVR